MGPPCVIADFKSDVQVNSEKSATSTVHILAVEKPLDNGKSAKYHRREETDYISSTIFAKRLLYSV